MGGVDGQDGEHDPRLAAIMEEVAQRTADEFKEIDAEYDENKDKSNSMALIPFE